MALPEPVRRGQVHPKDYQNEEYYGKLQPLVAALGEEIPDAKYDAKQLAVMLVQILHFQEAALGKDAMPPRICPKLPIRLITEPAVGGALHAIAVKIYEIKRARALKAIEWQNPGKRKECLEILVTLRRDLERRRLLKVPLVYISPSLGNETQRLREYVRRLQANLAESPDESGVTHMVFPFGPGGDPDDGKEYTTVVAVKGNMVRVHYWYQPDSYDEWISAKAVDSKEVVPDKTPPGGRWKVTPRWVVDSEKYNEWMNPADYTTPDFDAEMEAAEARGGKDGKRIGASLTGATKKARTDAGPEVASEPVSQLDIHVAVRKVITPHKALTDTQKTVENLSQGQINTHLAAYLPPQPPQAQRTHTSAAAAAADDPGTSSAAAVNGAGPGAGAACPPVRRVYSAPVSASWFRYDSIHEMERAGAPDFFNGRSDSKTPKLYRLYRDAMIGMYLELPAGEQLSFTAVRESLETAEVTGLQRIYDLLVSWGVINHNPNSSLAGPRLSAAQRIITSAGKVSTALPPGTACLFDFQRPSRLEASAATQQGGNFHAGQHAAAHRAPGSLLMPAFGRRGGDAGLQQSVSTPIYCSAMPWVECTGLRYHCTRYPDVNLCPEAYAEGRFPPGCSSRDFVRIDGSTRQTSPDGWRPEETLLLLEGIEMYKEDWAAVSAHVGTRSQAACLMHFVRLPIEDNFIEDIAGWGNNPDPAAAAGGSSDGQQVQQQQQLPFQDEHNPVMSTVAFLAVLMGPKVAAAAAQRAMQVMADNDLDALKDLTHVADRIAAGPAAAAAAPNGTAEVATADDDTGLQQEQQEQQQQQQQNGEQPPGSAAPPDPTQPVSKALMLSAAGAGLAAAAVRCQLLAQQEEREIQRLMVVIADLQQKKVDAKTKLFVEITQVVEKERQAAEASLKQLQAEHNTLSEQRKKAAAAKEAQQQQQKQKALAAEAMAKKQKQQQQTAAPAQGQQQQAGQPEQQKAGAPASAAAPAATAAATGLQQQHLQQQQQARQTAGLQQISGAPTAGPAAPTAQQQLQQPQQRQALKHEDIMDEDDDFDMP